MKRYAKKAMNLIPENTTRKLDNLGRIVIPKSLRTRLDISECEELEFFTMQAEGKNFICLTNNHEEDPKYRAAASVLEELGLDIPQELLDKLE